MAKRSLPTFITEEYGEDLEIVSESADVVLVKVPRGRYLVLDNHILQLTEDRRKTKRTKQK